MHAMSQRNVTWMVMQVAPERDAAAQRESEALKADSMASRMTERCNAEFHRAVHPDLISKLCTGQETVQQLRTENSALTIQMEESEHRLQEAEVIGKMVHLTCVVR